MYKYILLVLSLLYANTSLAQGSLSGKVYDADKKTIPFATIYIASLHKGTTSNESGFYKLDLAYGTYDITYRYMGYKLQTKKITISSKQTILNVTLQEEALEIGAITIDGSKNPAYAIIKKAQKARKNHLDGIESYTTKAYVKGMNHISEVPKNIEKMGGKLDTGIVYLSESVSKIQYKAPDTFSEQMIATKVSGNSNGFGFNKATGIQSNFYKNLVGTSFSERGFISPIAASCFLYYDYELLGVSTEDGLLINKIKVIPKTKSSPTVSGVIYIVENSWAIYALELTANKGAIDFIKRLTISQTYRKIENVWMLVTQNFNFDFKIVGIKGDAYFISIYQDYIINKTLEERKNKNEVFKIEKGANEKDSTYWNTIRPIPLTKLEKEDYARKDSIEIVKKSKPYLDSLQKKNNKITISKILFGGVSFVNQEKKTVLKFGSLASTLQYNTVEGIVINWDTKYETTYDNKKSWYINPTLRYGIDNKQFNAKIDAKVTINPFKSEYVRITTGSFVQQINHQNPISPLMNASYTLIDNRNYMKLYQRDFLTLYHQREWINGLTLTSFVDYAQRTPLYNLPKYTGKDAHHLITPNNPSNSSLTNTDFTPHEVFRFGLVADLVFRQKYMTTPYKKIRYGSKYPTLRLEYHRATKLFGSDISYEKLEAQVKYDFRVGVIGTSNIKTIGGMYTNTDKMTFLDYKHFDGNRTLQLGKDNTFQLLPYYQYSTKSPYLMTHYSHHFNGYFLNSIPLLKKLKFQEVFTFNYLYSKDYQHYFEVGVGIEHIFKAGRIDVLWSFEEGRQKDVGIRIGIGF